MVAAVAALAMLMPAPSVAVEDTAQKQIHDQLTAGGPWHFRRVPCADGTVSKVVPRLQSVNQTTFTHADFVQSGVTVLIALRPGTMFLPHVSQEVTGVVHYQFQPDNDLMESERRGDRVQVCLLSFAVPTYSAEQHRFLCDPDADTRGWVLRIYDYRQRAAYVGPTSEHSCGGA